MFYILEYVRSWLEAMALSCSLGARHRRSALLLEPRLVVVQLHRGAKGTVL